MSIKKIICNSLLAVSMSSVSVLAFAALTIVNNTNKDSTSIINDGICSNTLPGGVGVTKAKSTNIINDTIIGIACWGHASDCKADVFMTTNCNSGGASKIATVVMDTKKGIKSVTVNSPDCKFTASGFTIRVDGGPALASKN